jgi:hypothetical protein
VKVNLCSVDALRRRPEPAWLAYRRCAECGLAGLCDAALDMDDTSIASLVRRAQYPPFFFPSFFFFAFVFFAFFAMLPS